MSAFQNRISSPASLVSLYLDHVQGFLGDLKKIVCFRCKCMSLAVVLCLSGVDVNQSRSLDDEIRGSCIIYCRSGTRISNKSGLV